MTWYREFFFDQSVFHDDFRKKVFLKKNGSVLQALAGR
jgi:hypothetical protein